MSLESIYTCDWCKRQELEGPKGGIPLGWISLDLRIGRESYFSKDADLCSQQCLNTWMLQNTAGLRVEPRRK